nr:MAG TPA: hypothetical protein [Caudoviricetes sp.]
MPKRPISQKPTTKTKSLGTPRLWLVQVFRFPHCEH